MKKLLFPIALNEVSNRVQILHAALAALGLRVDEQEIRTRTAGESTVRMIRTLQRQWNIAADNAVALDAETAAAIEKELRDRGILKDDEQFSVSGTVRNAEGYPKPGVRLIAVDVDLRGAALVRKLTLEKEIRESKGLEWLGETTTDRSGRYSLSFSFDQFSRAERGKADVVVFAIAGERIAGRSRMVQVADYSETGSLRDLDIVFGEAEIPSEYQHVMGLLEGFLKENEVQLFELADSREQISFTAGELELDESLVDFAARAMVLVVKEDDKLSHPLLYALARSGHGLDLAALSKTPVDALQTSIEEAIRSQIIPDQKPEDIRSFLSLLSGKAAAAALSRRSEVRKLSLDQVLGTALPDKKLRAGFLGLLQNFQGSPQEFWTRVLPEQPGFKENPELVTRLQLTQQLTILTGNHLALTETLIKEFNPKGATDLLRLSEDQWIQAIKKSGLPADWGSGDANIKRYASQMRQQLEAAYPTQRIALMLEKKELPLQEKLAKPIGTFLSKAVSFHIGQSRIMDFAREIADAAGDQKEEVTNELLRMQRVFQVSTSPAVMSALMKNNFSSAHDIVTMPRMNFVRSYADELGGLADAYAVYQKARYITSRAEMNAMALVEMTRGLQPAMVMAKGEHQLVMEVLGKKIPNYSDLFGMPEICACGHCRSVFGPAAYFVDLLRFLWRGMKNDDGKLPLDMLLNRRPDLAHLPLTCENTDTLIPYIDLANEVMEFYTVHGSLDQFKGYDTGDLKAAELRADPQYVQREAYVKLKDALYPFTLPYHRPLDMIRVSGGHLKIGRDEVMRALRKDFTGKSQRAIDAESLHISPEEYVLFTGEDFEGNGDNRPVHQFYGYASSAQLEGMSAVPVFLERSGVSYVELTELIQTRFINPHQWILDTLQQLFRSSSMSRAEIYDRLKRIAEDTLDISTDAALMDVLNAAGKTAAEFTNWVKAHFNDFNEIITLYEPQSRCDLDTTVIRTLGKVYTGGSSSGLTSTQWSRIHRFIRLWRKLGWSIRELDLVLGAIGADDIDPEAIHRLSAVSALQETLKKPLDLLATAWGQIDTNGNKSLYKKLFLNKTVLSLDQVFQPDALGNILPAGAGKLGEHIPAILAAFRIGGEDLDAILRTARVTEGGSLRPLDLQTDPVNLPILSIIYRYAEFAKALKWKISDCCTLIRLFQTEPFSVYDVDEQKFKWIDPDSTLSFLTLANEVKTAGFKPELLEYIFNGTLPAESSLGLAPDKIRQTLRVVRDAFTAIEQDHPEQTPVPPTAELVRAKLGLSFASDVVTRLVELVEGTMESSVMSKPNLTINVPAALSEKFSYVRGSGRLVFRGIMTEAEKATLKGLSTDTAYKEAVDRLFADPEQFLQQHFNGLFSDMPGALAVLLNRPAQASPADETARWTFIYQHYIPLLRAKLREDALAQHVAALAGCSEDAARLLIGGDMGSLLDQLSTRGASAKYYSDKTFSTLALERQDAQIDANWDAQGPDSTVPGNGFSVRWEALLAPPASNEYTLRVRVREADESFTLSLDDRVILQKSPGDNTLDLEVVVSLNAAEMHLLRLDYVQNSGISGIRLSWKTATTAEEVIPASALFPAGIVEWFSQLSIRYHRAAKCILGFAITEKELDHFIRNASNFDAIDWKAIQPKHWRRLNDYAVLRNALPLAQADLIDLFRAAGTTVPAPSMSDLITLIALATAWDPATVETLAQQHFGFGVADFRNEKAMVRLSRAMSIVKGSGLPAAAVARWGEIQTAFNELEATAQLIRSAVQAKYEEEDWMEIGAKLSDALRKNQQQALISYLLVQPALRSWGVRDADGLFEYFLIDVQMGSCMDTSRIVQATAAVQQFVNRCLLNLESRVVAGKEKGVAPDAIDTDRWEWMKNYRVWEANRKVFLYPENWLEPEWRDDRSEFFRELESELVQNDIHERSVETAFRNYLAKLNEVAHLEVCGMYQENDAQGHLKLLHVFGRTHNAPYKVYYRTWNKFGKWSAWEKVQADVRHVEEGDDSGVHLLPYVWKDRLFLFWTELIEKKEPSGQGKNKSAKAASESGTLSDLESRIYWEIRLAWTEYVDGKWTPKQLSKEYLYQLKGSVTSSPSRIRLVGSVDGNNQLNIYTHVEFEGAWVELGVFMLADITAPVRVMKLGLFDVPFFLNKWDGYQVSYMNLKKTGKLYLLEDEYLKKSVKHKLLVTPTRTNYTPQLKDPFFFTGEGRTYFVKPVTIRIPTAISRPDLFVPIFPIVVDDSYFPRPNWPPQVDPRDIQLHEDLFVDRSPSGIRFTGGFAGLRMWSAGTNVSGGLRRLELPVSRGGRVLDGGVPASGGTQLSDGTSAGRIPLSATSSPVITGGFKAEGNMTALKYELKQISKVDAAFGGYYIVDHLGYWNWNYRWDRGLEFHTFYHPYSNLYVTRLNQFGMDGLMSTDTHFLLNDAGNTFISKFDPNFQYGLVQKPADFPTRTYFKENICFDVYGANSIYNWELFFHAPLFIATRLSKNGKYREAMEWFHYIFDPTTNAVPLPGESEISRYWKVQPFKKTPAEQLEDWFMNLDPNGNPATENLIIGEWADNPFMPHLVARNRPIAYMKHVVIRYVENLLDWADSLFRQFTRESVNEALQLYVIANHILGPRPQFVPRRGEIKAETFHSLQSKLDDFSNAIVQLENLFPYSSEAPSPATDTGPNLLGVGDALYFCIPANEKLLEAWDRAADRLYKIRHCMDINGVERPLALFAPPIDPAALIQAAAQGLSLGSILADLSSPPPIYRFSFLLQRANEYCAEVKALGHALLAALEKKDQEALGRLRATHERATLDMMTAIRERQVLEARAHKSQLEKAREAAAFRAEHFNALLGNESLTIPDVPALPSEIGSESSLPPDNTLPELVTDVDDSVVDSEEAGVKLISKEKQELDFGLASMIVQQIATAMEGIGGTMNFIPTFSAEIEPFGCGMSISFGGSNIAGGISGLAKMPLGASAVLAYMASHAAKMAQYIRREQEWTFQANMALREVAQLEKQITAAEIRVQIAEKELANHLKQIEQAREVEQFLLDKFTNQELYQWMKEQLFAVYKQSYNLCYELAKKAEKAYRYETGNELACFVQYGYWDNAHQGLLAGEKLQLALRQMEKSWLDENKRELELRKNISLAFVNPLALQELRQTGRCFVSLPEELFDLDFQGHYFRRIKAVSLSIPCVAGPMTTISCTLRLVRNTIRINTSMSEDGAYEHRHDEGVWIDDDRFRSSHVPVQAIAVSHAQQDSGMFELNFRDERYLPFEGSGVISDWKIELTSDADLRQFDYHTISDVVIHMNYTAREDTGLFRTRAVEHIRNYLSNAADNAKQPLVRMFSLRHEFPSQWHAFLHPAVATDDQELKLQLKREHFPFFVRNRQVDLRKVELLSLATRQGDYQALISATDTSGSAMQSGQLNLSPSDTYGGMQKLTLSGNAGGVNVDDMDVFAPLSVKLKHNSAADFKSLTTDPPELQDLFLVVHYKLS